MGAPGFGYCHRRSGSYHSPSSASRTTAGSFTLYLVDSTQGVLIQTDSGQLNLSHLQLQ
jgi:hypothetical protein